MKRAVSLFCAAAIMVSLIGCEAKTNPGQGVKGGNVNSQNMEQLLAEEITGEINISCYDTMFYKDFLDNAARLFESKYPGTKINVESFSAMPEVKTQQNEDGTTIAMMTMGDDSQAIADYISKINTELMSGGGADILAMDILPYYKYIENGQLENLQNYMDADNEFNSADYRKNILDAVKFGGGQYILPLDYSFDYYEYDSSLFNEEQKAQFSKSTGLTLEQLVNAAIAPFADKNKDAENPIRMFGMDSYSNRGSSMYSELLAENYKRFVDMENKKANFNDGNFAKLLETSKEWGEAGYTEPSIQRGEPSVKRFKETVDNQYFYKIKSNINLLLSQLKKEGGNIAFSMGGSSSGNEDNDTVAGMKLNNNGEAALDYSQAYGLNSNSKNKRMAWEFIKFLLSEEVQETLQRYSGGMSSLPIHNQARMKKAEDGIKGLLFNFGTEANTDLVNTELTESQQKSYDEYVENIENMSDLLNTYMINDNTITSIIEAEVEKFFSGEKSADEVAATIQSKVEMYLNE